MNSISYSILRLLITIILFSLFCISYAQDTPKEKITGTVKTVDGQPAEFVSVMLKDSYYGSTTDAEGNFSFKAPAGNYTMVVFSIFAHRKEFDVEIKEGIENTFPDITIIEDSKQLDAVVVTGQFSPQSLRNSVYKVRVVNSLQIKQKAAPNIQSLLNTEIGIRLSNDMALGETDFELMGMSGNNVKVLIDGVPVIDRGSNKQSLSQIDVNNIERVEIVEGPMSVVYGTDALAGVINIITKKASASPDRNSWTVSAGIQEETVGKEYKLSGGKGTHRENIHLGWVGKTGIYVNGGFTRNSTGGWEGDKTGREKMWQPKNQYMYDGTVGFMKKDFNVWYRLDYLDEEINTPANGSELVPTRVSDRKYITDRFNHQLQTDWKISSRMGLNVAASYQDYKRRTRTIVTNTETGEQWLSLDETAQDTTKMKSAFARATATWKALPSLTLQPGVEYQWSKASGDRVNGEPSIEDISAYISAEWLPADWLSIRPGVRSILNSDYDAPIAIPTLLTKFAINHNMDLRLSYAYGFRAPTLRELYFSFHNANHNIDGNPDLKAEYSNNFSAAFTWRILHQSKVRLTTNLSVFFNDFRDRITIMQDANDPLHNIYQNYDKYKTVGGTWENTLIWENLQANIGFSLVGRYNRYSDDELLKDDDLPTFRFSPELSSSITYKLEKSGTDFSLFYKFTGKREEYYFDSDTNRAYLRGMKAYNWADFTLSQKLWDYISINAGIKNIFNVTTIENTSGGGHGTTGTASLVGCGRSYFIGLNFHLTK
ncbi:MAG: TonB-dependent receptor [Prevotellaceae bacterium]|jgi:outer membrane receptor for ferrienterochelin and colicins|nr:TonB-dependent receptor [Prevotellaceae bacterium]